MPAENWSSVEELRAGKPTCPVLGALREQGQRWGEGLGALIRCETLALKPLCRLNGVPRGIPGRPELGMPFPVERVRAPQGRLSLIPHNPGDQLTVSRAALPGGVAIGHMAIEVAMWLVHITVNTKHTGLQRVCTRKENGSDLINNYFTRITC